jgi:hypothetical protein
VGRPEQGAGEDPGQDRYESERDEDPAACSLSAAVCDSAPRPRRPRPPRSAYAIRKRFMHEPSVLTIRRLSAGR